MDRNSKILTGCGIGCGAVVIIAIIIGIIIYNYVSDKVEYIENFEATAKVLEKKYDNFDEFSPEGPELLSESSFLSFLEIRDSIAERKDEFISNMRQISQEIANNKDDEDKSFSSVLGMIDTGFEAVPDVTKFFEYRDYLFDKHGISSGEYFYYFIMSYYVYLEKDIADGPNFPIPGNSHGKDFRFDGRKQDNQQAFMKEVRESRADDVSVRTNKFMLKVFNNILDDKKISQVSVIEEELERLRKDEYRIPFDGNRPEFIDIFFESYKERLENNYIDMLNPLEINPIKNERERRRKK